MSKSTILPKHIQRLDALLDNTFRFDLGSNQATAWEKANLWFYIRRLQSNLIDHLNHPS